jgi:hypothetical protein
MSGINHGLPSYAVPYTSRLCPHIETFEGNFLSVNLPTTYRTHIRYKFSYNALFLYITRNVALLHTRKHRLPLEIRLGVLQKRFLSGQHRPFETSSITNLHHLSKTQDYFLAVPATDMLAHKSGKRRDEIPVSSYRPAAVNGSLTTSTTVSATFLL